MSPRIFLVSAVLATCAAAALPAYAGDMGYVVDLPRIQFSGAAFNLNAAMDTTPPRCAAARGSIPADVARAVAGWKTRHEPLLRQVDVYLRLSVDEMARDEGRLARRRGAAGARVGAVDRIPDHAWRARRAMKQK